MMYVWIVIAAVVGAVGAWVLLDELGQREMKKLRQENEQLRKQLQHIKPAPVKFVETDMKVKTISCEVYFPIEDLDNPKKATKYIEGIIQRRLGENALNFCDIETGMEPFMHQLIVRARLRVVPSEKNCDLYGELVRNAAERFRSTVIGPEQFVAGNAGAMNFVMEAYALNAQHAEEGFLKMLSTGVVGDKLYMLWNDCCDRDTALAMAVMNVCAEDEILRHINYEQGRGIPFTEEEKEKLEYGKF